MVALLGYAPEAGVVVGALPTRVALPETSFSLAPSLLAEIDRKAAKESKRTEKPAKSSAKLDPIADIIARLPKG